MKKTLVTLLLTGTALLCNGCTKTPQTTNSNSSADLFFPESRPDTTTSELSYVLETKGFRRLGLGMTPEEVLSLIETSPEHWEGTIENDSIVPDLNTILPYRFRPNFIEPLPQGELFMMEMVYRGKRHWDKQGLHFRDCHIELFFNPQTKKLELGSYELVEFRPTIFKYPFPE